MPVFFYNSLKNKPKQPFQPHLYLSLSFCARYLYHTVNKFVVAIAISVGLT